MLGSFSCNGRNDSLNKEDARAKFLNATTELKVLCPIASIVSPTRQVDIDQIDTEGLASVDAKEKLRKIIKDLNNALSQDSELKEVYFFLGLAYACSEDVGNGIKMFEKSIAKEPQRDSTYLLLCPLLWDKERYDEALKVASLYLKRFPKEKVNGLRLLGVTYYKMSNFVKAHETGKKLLAIDDKDISGHVLLAVTYFSLGNKNMSEKEFEIVIRLDPKMRGEVEKIKAALNDQKKIKSEQK
jgi:tetratricopeptide (TPR) repeat protein